MNDYITATRVNYVGFNGEVVTSTYEPAEWTEVPGGSAITAVRLGDWVASENEILIRPIEVEVATQLFATAGRYRCDLRWSTT